METLQVTKTQAVAAYRQADQFGKKVLAELFGEKTFTTNIMETCTSMDAVYEIMGCTREMVVPFADPTSPFQEWINSAAECKLIEECLNEGWQPNWNDANQAKHTGWGYVVSRGAGFGLSDTNTHWTDTVTSAGCRLFFKNDALAAHAMKYFSKQIDTFTLSQFSIINKQ